MMTAAIAGLIITAFMMVQVWTLREQVTDAAKASINLIGVTLDTTSDALATVQQSLDSTATQVDSLDQMSQTLAQSMHDATPLVESLKTLTGKDIPSTLQSTERSLSSAQSSAKLIDDVLATLTRIPLLPVKPYQPDTSLGSALGQMTSSLDALNPSLAQINSSLNTTSGNLAAMETQTREMSKSIQGIKRNIADLDQSVSTYKQNVASLRARVNEISAAVPGLVTMVAIALSFVLGWLMITQVDLIIRGYALVRSINEPGQSAITTRRHSIRDFESKEV